MVKFLKQMISGQEGQALPIVLALLVLGGLTIVPSLSYATTSLNGGRILEKGVTELYAADAGVELAIWNVISGGLEVPEDGQSALPQFTVNAKAVNVTIDNAGGHIYWITSIATTDDGSATTVEACTVLSTGFFDQEFFVPEEGNFQLDEGVYQGNVHATGNVLVGENATIIGDLWAEGNVQLEVSGQIVGNIYAQGNVKLYEDAQITGDICAGGNVQLYNNAQITGDVHAGGNVQLYNYAQINGDVYTDQNVDKYDNAQIIGNEYPYQECPLPGRAASDILSWQIN